MFHHQFFAGRILYCFMRTLANTVQKHFFPERCIEEVFGVVVETALP